MKTVRELHNEAMQLSQLALVARHSGDKKRAEELSRQAYGYELRAVELIPDGKDSEPTRSIMHLSAASLAYQCREYQAAQELILRGLAGFPPPKVKGDLDTLREQVNFELNLLSRGATLVDEVLQMVLKGNAVAYGQILYSEFIKRVDSLYNIIDRTVQRKMGREYISSGRIPKMYKPFTRILSLEGGSFVVNLRLGEIEDYQKNFFIDTPGIIHEILEGIEFLNTADDERLRELIPAEGYYQNFITLARELAPDGDQISSVGFTSTQGTVNLTRQRSDILLAPKAVPTEIEQKREMIRVEGILDYASSRGGETIGLTTEDGKEYDIVMREGIDDLVRTYYKKTVVVTGLLTGRQIEPTDIEFNEG